MQPRADETIQAAEVRAAYERHLAAFMANDLGAIDALVQFPLAYLGNGVGELLEKFPIRPADLMARTGWCRTIDTRYEVVAISGTKAHVVLHSETRIRADGSAIERISAFYAWTRTPASWKLFALSDIRLPTVD